MNEQLNVGVLGATGMVGQRFLTLLDNHPWFDVVSLAASPRSSGKTYSEAVSGRWAMSESIPEGTGSLIVQDVERDIHNIASEVDMVFCALDMDKEDIKRIEIAYAEEGIPVVSNNSAHRWTDDVPMIIPEINPEHARLIDVQRQVRGWTTGLIAVKPNCSIQTYVPVLSALKQFKPTKVSVTSLQAVSGAGKTLDTWPEMVDNVIPLIGGEEDKSEREPLKIWGEIKQDKIALAESPIIEATCVRVPVSNGHLATVGVSFANNPTAEQILDAIKNYANPISEFNLPSAPQEFITYLEDLDRPQTRLDRSKYDGMGITMGRLRPSKLFDWQFVALSHNTVRGAAGGAILMAELLVANKYIRPKSTK